MIKAENKIEEPNIGDTRAIHKSGLSIYSLCCLVFGYPLCLHLILRNSLPLELVLREKFNNLIISILINK